MTRAELETVLVNRLRGKLSYVSLAVTHAGANADLNDPMRRAILFMGGSVASMTVADSDLSGFSGWPAEQLMDIATIETLKAIIGQCYDVDQGVEADYQRLSQFADQCQKQLAYLEEQARNPYGPGIPAPASGVINSGSRGLPNDVFNVPDSVSQPGYWPYPGNRSG